jgi:predicted ester cyclase
MVAEQSGADDRLADGRNHPRATILPEANTERLNTHVLRRGSSRVNPSDFTVSLRARGGSDRQLHRPGERLQPMRGFEAGYTDIIDYIVRATHRAWEEKDIGYIYELYSHNCIVQDDAGLIFGRDRVIENTISLIAAFPDIRLIASEIIWAGDDEVGFHTSHRVLVIGTNTGWSAFGPPTGRRVQFWLIANCVAIANEIFQEHVIYNTSSLVRQLGLDVVETARKLTRDLPAEAFVLGKGEPQRLLGQGKPDHLPPAPPGFDPEDFARRMLHYVWNWRMVGSTRDFFAPNMRYYGPTDRVIMGIGDYQAHVMSMLAMFPDLAFEVDDVYWMGNPADGYAVSVRWSAAGTHRGAGIYGMATGRPVSLWGINQYEIVQGRIQAEWTMFNEFQLLQQILR